MKKVFIQPAHTWLVISWVLTVMFSLRPVIFQSIFRVNLLCHLPALTGIQNSIQSNI